MTNGNPDWWLDAAERHLAGALQHLTSAADWLADAAPANEAQAARLEQFRQAIDAARTAITPTMSGRWN